MDAMPVRMEFIGGPYCGYVWYPNSGLIGSVFETDTSGLEAHKPDPKTCPSEGHFLDQIVVCMHGPLGEAVYVWSDADRWMHNPPEFAADTL